MIFEGSYFFSYSQKWNGLFKVECFTLFFSNSLKNTMKSNNFFSLLYFSFKLKLQEFIKSWAKLFSPNQFHMIFPFIHFTHFSCKYTHITNHPHCISSLPTKNIDLFIKKGHTFLHIPEQVQRKFYISSFFPSLLESGNV